MAKKQKALKPDGDGILRTGIYDQYVGEPKRIAVDELEEKIKQYCEHFHQPATERIGEIRKWLFSILKPHLTGPITQEKARSEPGDHRPLDDGKGIKLYTLSAGITAKDNSSVEAKQVQETLNAIHELDIVVHNLGIENVDSVVRSSIALGRLIERIHIRPFEPHARRGKETLESARTGGKLNASLTPSQKKEASDSVAALILKGKSQNSACDAIAADYKVSRETIARAYRGAKENK